jgi:hypothetical protein
VGRSGRDTDARPDRGSRTRDRAVPTRAPPRPAGDVMTVAGALLDGLDVVVLGPAMCRAVSPAVAQRLSRRARNRGAVLITLSAWPGAHLNVRCDTGTWHGGTEAGTGYLTRRNTSMHRRGKSVPEARIPLQVSGRGGAIARAVVERESSDQAAPMAVVR